MAEKGERRSPTSHRTPTQIRRQVRGYNHRPEQIKKRVQRDKARRKLMAEGVVRKGDGQDVNHKKPIRAGGSNVRSNLSVQSQSKNRAWAKKATKKGSTMASKKNPQMVFGRNPRLVEKKAVAPKKSRKPKAKSKSPAPKTSRKPKPKAKLRTYRRRPKAKKSYR